MNSAAHDVWLAGVDGCPAGWIAAFIRPEGDACEVAIFPREGETVLGPPSVVFQPVPEGKTVKNRVHLDLAAEDQGAEVARLEGLGARRIDVGQPADATFVVLADVEGNEFCVLSGRS